MSGHDWTAPAAYEGRGIAIRTYLAPHLQVWEVLCRCHDGCGNHGLHLDLLLRWRELRQALGMPISVSSGFRCPNHPSERVKPTPGLHAQGRALDLQWPGTRQDDMERFVTLACQAFRIGGVGLYRWGLHVDIAPGPDERRRWVDPDARQADGRVYERLEARLFADG